MVSHLDSSRYRLGSLFTSRLFPTAFVWSSAESQKKAAFTMKGPASKEKPRPDRDNGVGIVEATS